MPGQFDGHDHLPRLLCRLARDGRQARSRARCSRRLPALAAARDGRVRDLLRLRRHVLGQVRRDLVAARGQQVPACREHRRRRRGAWRPRVHAEHRGPAAAPRECDDEGAARRGSAGGRAAVNEAASSRRRSLAGGHASRVDALQGARARQAARRAAAAQPREDEGQVRRQAARVAGRARRLRGHARGGPRDPPARARRPRRLARDVRAQRRRARREGAVGARRRPRSTRWCSTSRPGTACARSSSRNRWCPRSPRSTDAVEGAGIDGRGDRPRRVHPADQRLRAAVAHHRTGAAQEHGGGRRALPPKHGTP